MGYGLTAMVVFYVVLNIGWLIVWQECARRLIGLRWLHALKDILPFLMLAAGVMFVAYAATRDMPISWLRIALRVAIAPALYVPLLWIAKARILRESIDYIFRHKA